ncbi:amidase family protein [Mesorhizobium sp. M0614]
MTGNPWNLERSAGGSSGVSAADVGARLLRLPMAAIVEGPFAPPHPV